MTATVRPVSPRPRGEVSESLRRRLQRAAEKRDAAESAYRQTIVEALSEASFVEVSKETGLSTNTLQRWKRDHG